MKLPASVLAALWLTGVAGCETTVDFERRSAPPVKAPVVAEKGEVERVEIEMRTYAKPPPAAAPITKSTPKPRPIPTKLVPVPAPKPQTNVCGPCGMG